jgi:hypothetical protein
VLGSSVSPRRARRYKTATRMKLAWIYRINRINRICSVKSFQKIRNERIVI